MGQIEWAMWANELAVVSAFLVLVGAVLGTIGYEEFAFWQCAAVAIGLSLITLVLEYPRSRRKKGSTIERSHQLPFVMIVDKLGVLGSNYYARFIILMLFSIPYCFLTPTLMGGLTQIIAAIIYLVAALRGEEWRPCVRRRDDEVGGVDLTGGLPAQPTAPPPRRPAQAENAV